MKNYDNFLLGVTNLEEARKYYEGTLGLKLKFDFSNKGMIAFNIGAEEPAIILKDENVFKNIKPTIWLEVENVETKYDTLLKNGVKFLSEPFEIMTGMAVEFEDPFGNRFGITDYSKKI
ncbi:VOC family protein [Clostridium chromiireducens]|uniref:Glyoxalase-like domain protein n=1 Tax=Clostridium chromiireducens TaxID=225345 RepID=A0A1V4IE89_9CLOT|nr:VOC family protein [Clostridium chromiireducens]OPJ58246.1 glyoxalase-like domain protein [Clostridium chromiireducens]